MGIVYARTKRTALNKASHLVNAETRKNSKFTVTEKGLAKYGMYSFRAYIEQKTSKKGKRRRKK